MRVSLSWFFFWLWLGPGLLLVSAEPESLETRFAKVQIAGTKTSIYVGAVTIHFTPFVRTEGVFRGDYEARVFPFFFYSEKGSLAIQFSDAQAQALLRGESVEFQGEGCNLKGEKRSVRGKATPEGPERPDGKIKVKVGVSRSIELIFNTHYTLPNPALSSP